MSHDRTIFKGYERRWDECLFLNVKIVSKNRTGEIIENCLKADTHFICHKSTIKNNGNICCRGFYDTQKEKIFKIRLAIALNLVKFVPLPKNKP